MNFKSIEIIDFGGKPSKIRYYRIWLFSMNSLGNCPVKPILRNKKVQKPLEKLKFDSNMGKNLGARFENFRGEN